MGKGARSSGAAMEEEAGEARELASSLAPKDLHFYHMDLYDSEDRLQTFPAENTGIRRDAVQAEVIHEPRRAGKGKTQRDHDEDADDLVHLFALDDDHELGGECVDENMPRIEVSEYPSYMLARGEAAAGQRDWRLGGDAAGAGGPGCGGWGSPGPCQDLREAYSYARGRASEEYACYVIPEEEDEAADVFCATCKTPLRASEEAFHQHQDHEVTPLDKALESAKVRSSRLLGSFSGYCICFSRMRAGHKTKMPSAKQREKMEH